MKSLCHVLKISIILSFLISMMVFSEDCDYDDYDDSDECIYDDICDCPTKPPAPENCTMPKDECPQSLYVKLSSIERDILSDRDGCFIRKEVNKMALENKSTEIVIKEANEKSCFLVYIDKIALGKILLRNDVVRGLSQETIDFMVRSPSLAQTFEELPTTTIAKMINANPKIAASFPTDKEFHAKRYMEKIMMDKEYIGALKVEILAYLAETPFRSLLSQDVIHTILDVHPDLTLYLSTEGKTIIPELLHKPFFLERLRCRVIQNIASDLKFINGLSGRDMRKLIHSHRIWNCLTVEEIRKLLSIVRLGDKVNFRDLSRAARLLSKDKLLDRQIIWNMFRYQLPDIARNRFMNLLHDTWVDKTNEEL